MMLKQLLVLCLILLGSLPLQAQAVTPAKKLGPAIVEGEVVDADDGEPLPGITVRVKNSNVWVVTDMDGRFRIQVQPNDILQCSCMGYLNTEFQVNPNQEQVQIKLEKAIEAIQAVTIVGYGKQRTRDLTGSVSSIKGKDLDPVATSFDNALAGKLAGVQVTSSSGVPGSATSITIRGLTSLNANSNNPLIVIDGVPVYGSDRDNNSVGFERTSVMGGIIGGGSVSNPMPNKNEFERNPLAMLNVKDIQSIEVLKDAYATAIYGSRGAAGVILITTKSGAIGKPRIQLNYSSSWSNPVGQPEVLDAQEYSSFYNQYYNGNYFPEGQATNWLEEVTRPALTHNLSSSFSGGSEKTKFYISLGLLDQESYIVNQDYKKYSGRINMDYYFNERLQVGTNMSLNFSNNSALNAQSIYRNAVLKGPNIQKRDLYGNYYFGYSPNIKGMADNPLAQAFRDVNYVRDFRAIGNAYVDYEVLDGLALKSVVGIDNFTAEAYSRLISRPDLEGGSAVQTTSQNLKLVMNNTLTYDRGFGKHAINALLGQSFETSREQATSIFGRDFNSDEVMAIGRAGDNGVSGSLVQEWALFSAFSRISYQYDNKYLAGITYRIDGSSRFNKNNRYIGFPSYSLGWRLSEEEFMQGISWMNDLKFRGSLGFTGIDGSSGYYGNQGQYMLHPYALQYNGISIVEVKQPNNPNLEWEKTHTLDLGVDASLFDARLNLQLDYYHKKISNLLYASAVPWTMGYSSQLQNIGSMENRGIELTLNTINIETPDFTWSSDFNISRNTNKILELNFEGADVTGPELGYKYFAEGESAAQFFLYDWAGVNPLTGNPLWNYPDGTQSETPPASRANPVQYRKPMGDALPDFFGGLTNTFRYKNFDLSAFFSFSYGGQLYNGSKALLMTYSQDNANNLSTDMLDHWLIPGHHTEIPKIHNASMITNAYGGTRDYTAGRDSDRFLEDASYARLKTLRLGYRLGKALLEDLFLENVEVYAQGNNLWTLTSYSGSDPEVSAFGSSALLNGYDELTLPQAKTYSVGINVGF